MKMKKIICLGALVSALFMGCKESRLNNPVNSPGPNKPVQAEKPEPQPEDRRAAASLYQNVKIADLLASPANYNNRKVRVNGLPLGLQFGYHSRPHLSLILEEKNNYLLCGRIKQINDMPVDSPFQEAATIIQSEIEDADSESITVEGEFTDDKAKDPIRPKLNIKKVIVNGYEIRF